MSTHFPDHETIRSALSLAIRAPSVHNSQPWRWRVGDRSLHLYADPALHLPNTDPDARDLMLSCGATLNHCVVALTALGWQSKVHRFPNPADADHVAAIELLPYTASEVDIELAAAIPRRRTDRRNFSSWPVPHDDIALMGARVARAGVILRRIDSLSNLARIVVEASRRHATDYDYLSELATWNGRCASRAEFRHETRRNPIRLHRYLGACSPAPRSHKHRMVARRTTTPSWWRWARSTTMRWLGFAPVRRPAWCCLPPPRWDWRVARSRTAGDRRDSSGGARGGLRHLRFSADATANGMGAGQR